MALPMQLLPLAYGKITVNRCFESRCAAAKPRFGGIFIWMSPENIVSRHVPAEVRTIGHRQSHQRGVGMSDQFHAAGVLAGLGEEL